MSSSSQSSNWVNWKRRNAGWEIDNLCNRLQVWCECGDLCGKWTTWTQTNPERRFLGCPNYKVCQYGRLVDRVLFFPSASACVKCESRVSKSERGGKKNNINKHDEQLAGKKINTNGLFGLGFGSDFPPLVDDTGIVHVQDGGLNDVNTVTWGACNTGSIPVTNVAKENKGFAVNAIPTVDDGTAMSSAKLDTADSIPLTLTSAGPMLLNKANLRKLDANVPIDSDFDIWLSLDSVNEGKSSYARILIKIDASNGFCENLVMAVPNLDGPGYRKEKIHVEYELDKDKGGSSGADDDGFIEDKKKKTSGNTRGTKYFKPVSVKTKTLCRPKVIQPTKRMSPKTAPSAGKKKVSAEGNSSKKTSKNNASTSGNGIFPLVTRLRLYRLITWLVRKMIWGISLLRLVCKRKGKVLPPVVENINIIEKKFLERECVLMDDDGKPLKKVECSGDLHSEAEVEPNDNEMASFLAKPSRVGYGTKSLLEQ
ncbi:hypothetical protein Tco_0781326 [Tanacetum coccineum]